MSDPESLVERNTHLLDWLEDGHTHCQHGTKDWCEGYLHNARDVIKAQDAQLSAQREHIRKQAEDIMTLGKLVYASETETWHARAEALRAARDDAVKENTRWQENWDANVQEMSEKFRAVNLAKVMAGTNVDLLDRALAAEAARDEAVAALEEAREALRVIATGSGYEWSETREQLHRIIDAAVECASNALTQPAGKEKG